MAVANQTIRVLFIEEDPSELRLIRNLLEDRPSVYFAWELAEKLSTAIKALRMQPFDLVLLDLSLLKSQGLELFSQLFPHALCLPIVLLADIDDEPMALQAVQNGAQDYLIKGQIDGEPFVQALRQAIERKRAETALLVKIRNLTVLAHQLEQAVRIGYELNNSLALIILSVEALLAQFPTDDLKRSDLQTVHDEISRMGRLVANLLQLSQQRPSQTRKAGHPAEVQDTPDLIQYLRDHRIVTVHDDETYFFQSLEAGTAGYILKGASINELVTLMHHISQEGMLIPRTLGQRLLNHYSEDVEAAGIPNYGQLTPREREIVRLIAKGRANKEIAKRLEISVRTVERHRSSIMNKLGLQNRAELVAYAVQQGLLRGGETK